MDLNQSRIYCCFIDESSCPGSSNRNRHRRQLASTASNLKKGLLSVSIHFEVGTAQAESEVAGGQIYEQNRPTNAQGQFTTPPLHCNVWISLTCSTPFKKGGTLLSRSKWSIFRPIRMQQN